MSRIAPDIPELSDVPEMARPLVYMSALYAAIRSPAALIPGLILLVIAGATGATAGARASGSAGMVIGGGVGAALAVAVFYKVLLPRRARRLVPQVLQQQDRHAFDNLVRADDALKRMTAAYNERERRPRSARLQR